MPHHLGSSLLSMKISDIICTTIETMIDSKEDCCVIDKNNPSKLIHLGETVLLDIILATKKVFYRIYSQSGFAAITYFLAEEKEYFCSHKIEVGTYTFNTNNPDLFSLKIQKTYSINY